MDNYEELGERIAEKRNEKDYSQQELAGMLGISQTLLAKIETGSRRIQVDTLADIAKALDTDCDYLVRGIKSKHLNVEQYGLCSEAADVLKTMNDSSNVDNDDNDVQMNDANQAIAILNSINILLTCPSGLNLLSKIDDYIIANFKHCLGVCDVSEDRIHMVRLDRINFKTPPGNPYVSVSTDCLEIAFLQEVTDLLRKVKQEVTSYASKE